MSDFFGKLIGVVLALVVGFFVMVYISAPLILDIYKIMIQPYVEFVPTKEFAIGVMVLIQIAKYKYVPADAGKTITDCFSAILSGVLFICMAWGMAHLYHWYLN